ncbi:MAG TPA: putative Fe-S cluster assembly protein SufT [Verrucomicrobiae bacterium]|jgi:probable FeS assembly SUF system protein SufT
MNPNEAKILTRDVEASVVPVGTKVTLQKGGQAYVTQSLGGSYTVIVNGNMFRIDGKDADALGLEIKSAPATTVSGPAGPISQEQLEKQIWDALKTCYDPEIPVNVVDLGLIYDCHLTPAGESSYKADVKMTLTAPGCGMGPVLAQDVQNKLLSLEPIDEANVELVWDPPWNQSMMTEAAKLQLGLM